uniref:Uncharacterized protein n=1 Tax=Anopheles atroparvus TaxID=41427 RepID=A0A182IS86_ANOAO
MSQVACIRRAELAHLASVRSRIRRRLSPPSSSDLDASENLRLSESLLPCLRIRSRKMRRCVPKLDSRRRGSYWLGECDPLRGGLLAYLSALTSQYEIRQIESSAVSVCHFTTPVPEAAAILCRIESARLLANARVRGEVRAYCVLSVGHVHDGRAWGRPGDVGSPSIVDRLLLMLRNAPDRWNGRSSSGTV